MGAGGKAGPGFGGLLRRYRSEAALTQEELAERAGLSVRAVSDMERGRTGRPMARSVRVLSDALGLPEHERARLISTLLPAHSDVTEPGQVGGADGGRLARPLLPRQLPAGVMHFAGRAAELKVMGGLLDRAPRQGGAVVISAIGGTAGVGKTALALRFAHQAADAFPDGQLYVNLRGFGPLGTSAAPEEAIRGFLDALGVPAEQIPGSADAQVALYRSLLAGRRVLVVLDNARHEQQVRPLLPASAGCLAVVTSRRRLTGLAAIDGAHLLDLDVMTDSESLELLAARLGPGTVSAEPEATAQVIALCDRLPLALGIAAARAALPGLSLGAVAAALHHADQRLDALDTGDRTASIRGVLSWSYDNLREPAATMFRQLGLHPGPEISLPAAASLAGLPRPAARVLLGELVNAHLLTERTPGRFALHDLLRAYAAEQTAAIDTSTQRHAAIHRMLDHYLHTAHGADRVLNPGRTPIALAPPKPGADPEYLLSSQQALAWFEAERGVLRAAITMAAASGFDTHAWQIPWTLVQFFDWRGNLRARLVTQRTALAAARRAGNRLGQAHAHRALGRVHTLLSRFANAHTHLDRALTLYRELSDLAGQADTHHALGNLSNLQNRQKDHMRHEQDALTLFQASGQRTGQANALNSLAHAHAQLGNRHEALACAQQAIEQHSQLGNRFGQAQAWDTLGNVQEVSGNHAEAIRSYQRALTLCQELGSRYYQSVILSHLGASHQAAGNAQAAANTWRHALNILTALNHPDAAQARANLQQIHPPITTPTPPASKPATLSQPTTHCESPRPHDRRHDHLPVWCTSPARLTRRRDGGPTRPVRGRRGPGRCACWWPRASPGSTNCRTRFSSSAQASITGRADRGGA
jgi:tetratricopeptide (TPR) repeat protein/transcriptional regulator with XRE-family HTH domain